MSRKKSTAAVAPVGIGGWLLLPVFSLILSPVYLTESIYAVWTVMNSPTTWNALTSSDGPLYHPWWQPVLIVELGVNVALLIAIVVLLALLFTKNRRFPSGAMACYAVNLLYCTADFFGARAASVSLPPDMAELVTRAAASSLITATALAVAFIPYLYLSARVKNTFVR